MTSDPITSWQIEENVKAVKDFILGGSKITMDSNCIHKIKRHLLFGRKAMTNLDSILKKKKTCHFASRDPYSQSYLFSSSHVWIYELDHKEGLALKNWYFWTVVLKKTPTESLCCKKIKLVNPKKINPEYSLERQMFKLQQFSHLIWRADSLEKTLMLGKTEDKRRKRRQRMRWLDSITDSVEIVWAKSRRQRSLECCSLRGHRESDTTEWLNNNIMFTIFNEMQVWRKKRLIATAGREGPSEQIPEPAARDPSSPRSFSPLFASLDITQWY